MKFARLVVAIWLWILSFSIAAAQGRVVPADGDVVRLRQYRSLDLLHDEFQFPKPPIANGVVLLIRLNASGFTAQAFGPVKGDARDYAERLNRWQATFGGKQEVYFSQQDDCASAVLTISVPQWMNIRTTQSVDHPALLREFQGLGSVYAALRAPAYAKVSGAKPDLDRATYRAYRLSESSPKLVADFELPAYAPLALWAFVAFVPTVCLLGLGAAAFVGTRSNLSLERRRSLYGKLSLYPVYGAIGVHLPFAVWVIVTRQTTQIADHWFGATASTALAPLLMFSFLLMTPIPIFMKGLESRLFGPTEAERSAVADLPLTPERKAAIRKLKLVGAAILITIAIPLLWLSFSGFRSTPFGTLLHFALLLPMAFVSQIARWILRSSFSPVPNPELEHLARDVAERMGVPLRKVQVSRSPEHTNALNGFVNQKGDVTVTERSLVAFTDDELRFLLAHEFAHIKLGHLRSRWPWQLVLVMVATSLAVPGLILYAGSGLPLVIGVMTGMTIAMYFIIRSSHRPQNELDADAEALSVTRNLAAAESTLWKLRFGSEMPHAPEVLRGRTHPEHQKRVEALRALAASW